MSEGGYTEHDADKGRGWFLELIGTLSPALLIAGALLMAVVMGGVMAYEKEQRPKNGFIPVASYSQCVVDNAESFHMKYIRKYYIYTSCGHFQSGRELFSQVEIGKSYDFGARKMSEKGMPYLTNVKVAGP